MTEKDELGRDGEAVAATHLQSVGLLVLDRNWRCREGELDIVATNSVDTLIFCEVKTRRGVGYGMPVESVTAAKRRRLRRLAQLWMASTGAHSARVRFDVVGIVWPVGQPPEVRHIEDAF